MGFNVSKDDRPPPQAGERCVVVRCGWSLSGGRSAIDLDCHAFALVHPDGKPALANLYRPRFGSYPLALTYANDELVRVEEIAPEAFRTSDGSLIHFGKSIAASDDLVDEELRARLHLLPDRVDEVAIWVTVRASGKGKDTFASAHGSFVRVADLTAKKVLCYYPLREKFAIHRSVHVASLVRDEGRWAFVAVGVGLQAGLEEILEAYRRKGAEADPEACGSDVRRRTMAQFRAPDAPVPDPAWPRIGMEDVAAANPEAPEEIARAAITIVESFGGDDPESRYAIFGSDQQKQYGELMQHALKLGRDQRYRWAKESLTALLKLIDSIDFGALTEPEPTGFWAGLRRLLTKTPPALTPDGFNDAAKKVKTKLTQLTNHLESLRKLRDEIIALEQRRLLLLGTIRAHVMAGRALCERLEGERQADLGSRVQSLTITVVTGLRERQGALLTAVIDGMTHAIRDTMETWIPVWLSAGKETFGLYGARKLTREAEPYRRAIEARTAILEGRDLLGEATSEEPQDPQDTREQNHGE